MCTTCQRGVPFGTSLVLPCACLHVLGNHGTDTDAFIEMGGDHLDGRIVRIGGLRIAGLDGSLDYRDGIVGFSEREMRVKAMRLAMLATLTGGIDVLVTHAPVRGHGDLDDRPHQGFECFNWLLNLLHPKALLHGHVHLDYGMIKREVSHPSGARIINAYGHYLVEDF